MRQRPRQITGPEVIQGDHHAEMPECRQQRRCGSRVIEQGRLGHFDDELFGFDGELLDDLLDVVQQLSAQHVPRGDVDRHRKIRESGLRPPILDLSTDRL